MGKKILVERREKTFKGKGFKNKTKTNKHLEWERV